MKRLVQIFVPFQGEQSASHAKVKAELTERFGGLTAFVQAPAEGLWKDQSDKITRDQIVVFEVMASDLDRDWWNHYRRELERRFAQDSILIRVLGIEIL